MSRSVARSELTLEIGGGHNPAPAADVVVDKFLFDNSQRAGSLRCDRPLVIGDGESLPFRDKAFARTVGRQVMEHMDDVQRFFQELMRVSSGGYLASPSYLRELVFWWPYHHWLFTREKDVLVCAPKSGQRPLAGQLFHYLARQDRHFRRFLRALPVHVLHVQYQWTERIDYRIVEQIPVPAFNSTAEIEAFWSANRPASHHERLKHWALRTLPQPLVRGLDGVRRVCHSLRRARIRSAIDLDALLACPLCKQAVRREGERYVCGECGRRYPIVRGIPVMLADAEAADAVVEHARRAA